MGIATTSTITAGPRQLSDQNPIGTTLGASSTDLIGFYGLQQGVAQATPTAVTTGYTTGTGTAVTIDGKFSGNVGTTSYTIGDLVAILKGLNLIKP